MAPKCCDMLGSVTCEDMVGTTQNKIMICSRKRGETSGIALCCVGCLAFGSMYRDPPNSLDTCRLPVTRLAGTWNSTSRTLEVGFLLCHFLGSSLPQRLQRCLGRKIAHLINSGCKHGLAGWVPRTRSRHVHFGGAQTAGSSRLKTGHMFKGVHCPISPTPSPRQVDRPGLTSRCPRQHCSST